jgi:hypothetical protein
MHISWQTDEVIRHLFAEGDQDEIQELLEESGDEAAEVLAKWVREGNAPKSLYDAVMRFTASPTHAFDAVDWEVVVERVLNGQGE